MYHTTFNSPLGKLIITANNSAITHIQLTNSASLTSTSANIKVSPLITETIKQLEHYFQDAQYQFNLPINPQGTPFQQKVWQALCKIPAGKTKTYGELAQQLNTSPRAIGNACRTNPILIIIPCHRVVSKNGLGGFMGQTAGQQLKFKKWLLEHEL